MQSKDQPYCRACGYSLVGLTESSKCPECGRPIVDILVRDSFPGPMGRRYQSSRRIFGLPLVSIAFGPHGDEKIGKPVGAIAIGDAPLGLIAIGGRAMGVLAIGGFAAGVVSIGGFAVGLGLAFGGFTLGILSIGGFAAGAYAIAGTAVVLFGGIGGRVIYLLP